jgi:hypothetical protein
MPFELVVFLIFVDFRKTNTRLNVVNFYGMAAGRTEHKRRLELIDKLKLSGEQPFKIININLSEISQICRIHN